MTDKKQVLPPSRYRHEGSDNSAPYPVSRMAPAVELVDLAKEIAHADEMLGHQVNHKLRVIADQIKNLQHAATEILETARRDQQLNQAECNLKKIPGKIYHFYRKENGKCYLSMLSPGDWGSAPHEYIGAYRYEADCAWTAMDEIDEPLETDRIIRNLLEGK